MFKKAIIKKRSDWKHWGLRSGEEVEVKLIGYDEIYKQDMYWIKGKSFWLPEKDLRFDS